MQLPWVRKKESPRLNSSIPEVQGGQWLRLALGHYLQGPGSVEMGGYKLNPYVITWGSETKGL